ncbi:MAG: hypothetical protein LR011_06935 [Verrucomicrobia bacterium]|nr:hypothetical protein [Verrucomicrobiota bacterium]
MQDILPVLCTFQPLNWTFALSRFLCFPFMDTPRPIANGSLQSYPERKAARTIMPRSSIEESGPGISLKPFNPDAPTARTWANLPHWNQEGTTYWVTFRLTDLLPQEKIKPWKAE